MSVSTWKEVLQDQMPEILAREIDVFGDQMELMRQGKLDERVFGETRLRRGVYGQRYDNGQRHDGVEARRLAFPQDLMKGVETLWDAPGMQRIKIPFGGVTPEQMEALADVADEYSVSILHVTTRQDFQLHFVHIDDTPDMMRRLAAVGITTREACGNSVRNVTACPLAGVCRTESFDVTPYANAMAQFLLGHDDVQDFGRKVKIAFSGCEHEACGLVKMHDLGLLAQVRAGEGGQQRGFRFYIGGGLGTIPHQAKVLYDFVSEEELLPVAQAVSRVFARLGEKRNRNRARLKFLVADLDIDEFRRLVAEERDSLPHDPRWTAYRSDLAASQETPARMPIALQGNVLPTQFEEWAADNVYAQRQPGYAAVTVNLPLGDITGEQMRLLADLARTYAGGNVRTTVEQNLLLRWVAQADLPELYRELAAIGLGEPGAGTIVDITACPGAATCKLGIAASRGLADELRTRLAAQNASLPDAIKNLKIKISGCFNSCGHHHVADIGFFGNSRRSGNLKMPHFQVVLGGQWQENAGSYGLAIGAVPSKAVPDVVDAITQRYVAEREPNESFQHWIGRLGKKGARSLIEPYMELPSYLERPDFFTDWGDVREFTLGDIGIGECAGEMVSLFSIEITKAESEAFAAQVALEELNYARADWLAYHAMLLAVRALVRTSFLDVGDDADNIVHEFRVRFYDTKLFFDKYAKGKFGRYLLDRHENPVHNPDSDQARRLIGESLLFIEAVHECESRISQSSLSLSQPS